MNWTLFDKNFVMKALKFYKICILLLFLKFAQKLAKLPLLIILRHQSISQHLAMEKFICKML